MPENFPVTLCKGAPAFFDKGGGRLSVTFTFVDARL